MRTIVSILLIIVCAVAGFSASLGANAGVSTSAIRPAVSEAASAASGFGRAEFWWSSFPAGEICENDSYASYDAAAGELMLRRGADFTRVIEDNLSLSSGLSVAPGCGYIAGKDGDSLVIWDVTHARRTVELPDPQRDAGSPLVIWSPDGDGAFVRTSSTYYLWDGGDPVALYAANPNDWTLDVAPYPAAYWDNLRGQIIVSGEGGVLAFDSASGMLMQTFAGAGDGSFRVMQDTLVLAGDGRIDLWNLETGVHLRLPTFGGLLG